MSNVDTKHFAVYLVMFIAGSLTATGVFMFDSHVSPDTMETNELDEQDLAILAEPAKNYNFTHRTTDQVNLFGNPDNVDYNVVCLDDGVNCESQYELQKPRFTTNYKLESFEENGFVNLWKIKTTTNDSIHLVTGGSWIEIEGIMKDEKKHRLKYYFEDAKAVALSGNGTQYTFDFRDMDSYFYVSRDVTDVDWVKEQVITTEVGEDILIKMNIYYEPDALSISYMKANQPINNGIEIQWEDDEGRLTSSYDSYDVNFIEVEKDE